MRRALLISAAAAALAAGCIRYPPEERPVDVPERMLDVTVVFYDAVRDDYYYFFAIDTDEDETNGPLPVVQGPYWGNGWGTGSMSYYVSYHNRQYEVNRVRLVANLINPSGGIARISGTPTTRDTGEHRISIDSVTLGQARVEGSGMIIGVTNESSQNAGTYTISTDSAGNIVAGSVSFTPAEPGGRPLTLQEENALAQINSGGPLAEDTFAALGLRLTLGPPQAGTQQIVVEPTTAQVTDRFQAFFGGNDYVRQGVLRANSEEQGPTPVIPGLRFTTTTLVAGTTVDIITQYDQTADPLGPPFQSWEPAPAPAVGGAPLESRTLRFQLDLAQVGDPEEQIQINFIAVLRPETNPEVDTPQIYDALGEFGSDYATIRLTTNQTFTNAQRARPEQSGDASPGAIDIVDWRIEVQLRQQSQGL